MKFPGKRKSKHFFPVQESGRMKITEDISDLGAVYIVGLEQLLVDIEANVPFDFLQQYGIKRGESEVFSDEKFEEIYLELKKNKMLIGEFPGGAIGNTLHNFSTLSDSKSVAFGAISSPIYVGDYAYKYITNTHSLVDMSHLHPCQGPIGRALCLLTPDKERSFVLGKGVMNDLDESSISEEVIKNASLVLVSAFSFRNEQAPIYRAHFKAMDLAKKYHVPIVLSLGTSELVKNKRDFFIDLIKNDINIVAMNELEAAALADESDPLKAIDHILDWTDLVLYTNGPKGLYIGAHVDDFCKRETKDPIYTKSIRDYNRYEYSRAQLKADCKKPLKIFTHINPFMGGPAQIKNTNGAGDAALAALLHDIAANTFHRQVLPQSEKHQHLFLTYSSIHQISKYCNRVSYEILMQNSPRLFKGLSLKDESLEDGYWAL